MMITNTQPTGRMLRRRIIAAILAVSLLPVLLLGVGSWVVFGRLLEEKAMDLQRAVVSHHAESVDSFMQQQVDMLSMIPGLCSMSAILADGSPRAVLQLLNESSNGAFVDLGVIDHLGRHRGYAGPYDLLDKNYAKEPWFHEVMKQGVFVSDVFLGFRGVPHVIIAVRVTTESEPWILRATINSDRLKANLLATPLGEHGDVWLVNLDGELQSDSRELTILEHAPLPALEPQQGVREDKLEIDGESYLIVSRWINNGRWLLAAVQPEAEVRAPIRRAILLGGVVVVVAIVIVFFTTLIATWRLTRLIDKITLERDRLQQAFNRSAKLASVGELATGLAHEINNPLAIIGAEQTNLRDLLSDTNGGVSHKTELLESVDLVDRQVKRCASITTRMLQFGRKQAGEPRPTVLLDRLTEIVDGLERQLTLHNVAVEFKIPTDLPPVLTEPIEFEQVMHNLFANALHAMPDGGAITLRAYPQLTGNGWCILLEVSDTGTGMSVEIAERAFEPFFTTKPVGQGTGLGLSVCYGMVAGWGGEIELHSQPGKGTTVRLQLPAASVSAPLQEGVV